MYNNYNLLWISANKLGFKPKRYGNSFEIICANCDQDKLQKWIEFHFPNEVRDIKNTSSFIIENNV